MRKTSKKDQKEPFFRMWPRALFHMQKGKEFLRKHLSGPGVYVLYRNEEPYYIGRANNLFKRVRNHALRPNARRYNFWNYFSAFEIEDTAQRDRIERILIRAMPTIEGNMRKYLAGNLKSMINIVKRPASWGV